MFIYSNSATTSNIINKSKLFDETSIVFGLFIGYLIVGSKSHKVDEYANIYIAYLCIQGRGIVAMIGTFCIIITKFITNSVDELLSKDIEPDTEIQEQKQRSAIYKFLQTLEYIQIFTYSISFICFIIFIICYYCELYSLYYNDLNFIIFTLFLLISFIIMSIFIIIILYEKYKTLIYIKTLKNKTINQLL